MTTKIGQMSSMITPEITTHMIAKAIDKGHTRSAALRRELKTDVLELDRALKKATRDGAIAFKAGVGWTLTTAKQSAKKPKLKPKAPKKTVSIAKAAEIAKRRDRVLLLASRWARFAECLPVLASSAHHLLRAIQKYEQSTRPA